MQIFHPRQLRYNWVALKVVEGYSWCDTGYPGQIFPLSSFLLQSPADDAKYKVTPGATRWIPARFAYRADSCYYSLVLVASSDKRYRNSFQHNGILKEGSIRRPHPPDVPSTIRLPCQTNRVGVMRSTYLPGTGLN